MCGIAGFVDLSPQPSRSQWDLATQAARMEASLVHRGPDDDGVWVDPACGVALAFRRLAIVDVSPAGRQPMESNSGRYVIVFNGEVYNHSAIRQQLQSLPQCPPFHGHSDTEVLLAAIEAWGLVGALERSVGMFAIALWDRRQRVLQIARDRIGEKPLYYGLVTKDFVFGSELKALRAHADFRGDIDRGALALFMRHGYVPGPYSIYAGIRKLPPGTVLSIQAGRRTTSLPDPLPYWSAKEVAETGSAAPFTGSSAEAMERLESHLVESVRSQMVADVPLGAFLSGGIDSSLIVAIMQRLGSRPTQTFSIGFHEADYNEAHHARQVAQHLGTEHTELYVSAAEAMSVIPRLPAIYDEPFADSSQIPTYLVSRLARQSVTISVSGDGGDELFSGYGRYRAARHIWRKVGLLPSPIRRGIARAISAAPARVLDGVLGWLKPFVRGYGNGSIGGKLHRAAGIMEHDRFDDLYRQMVSYWQAPELVVRGSHEHATALTDGATQASLPDISQRMLYLDTVSYLPDDILVKVDRASMAVSLESRAPFLDHRVVEFAWRLPASFKDRGPHGKWILRQLAYKYIPQTLLERPKMGFGIPVGDWLRGPLRDWAEHLLSERQLAAGNLAAAPIRQKWQQHIAGTRNWQHDLWIALMFQAWCEAERQTQPIASLAA